MVDINVSQVGSKAVRSNGLDSLSQPNTRVKGSQNQPESGKRITAGDDSSGVNISSMRVAAGSEERNRLREISDGENLVNSASNGLNKVKDFIQRMRDMAVKASSDQTSGSERSTIQTAVKEMRASMDNAVGQARYKGNQLLTGSADMSVLSKAGVDKNTTSQISGDYSARGLGVSGVDVSSQSGAARAMDTIDSAMQKVDNGLSALGTAGKQLSDQLQQTTARVSKNGEAAKIQNAVMAQEQLNTSRQQILQNSSTAVMAQASFAPQSLLGLFR